MDNKFFLKDKFMYNKNQTNVSNSQNNTPIDSNQNEVINPNKLFSSLKGLRTFLLKVMVF